jgi:DNA polymerase-3 subunit epsilon
MSLEKLAQTLASHLTLGRPLICFDLETTGISVATDRIVQIAVAKIYPDGHIERWSSLVDPEQPIPAAASAIHSISDETVADAPTFAQLADTLVPLLAKSDLAGYNIRRFDIPLLSKEFKRTGIDDPSKDARVVDAYVIWIKKEPRTLSDAIKHYAIDSTGQAHDADSDVQDAAAVLVAQLERYNDLPTTVDELDALAKDPSWVDANGRLIWREGVAVFAFGKYNGQPLRDIAKSDPGYLVWMLSSDFTGEVQAIIRAALEGQFPGQINDKSEA